MFYQVHLKTKKTNGYMENSFERINASQKKFAVANFTTTKCRFDRRWPHFKKTNHPKLCAAENVLLFASSIFNFDGASETWHPEYRGPLGPQTLMPTHIIFTENQKSDDPDQRRIHSKLTRYSMGRTIGLSFLEQVPGQMYILVNYNLRDPKKEWSSRAMPHPFQTDPLLYGAGTAHSR